MEFWSGFIAVMLISIISISFSGVFIYARKKIQGVLYPVIALAAGVMTSDALLHLIPEAYEEIGIGSAVGLLVLLGIVFFFVFEKFIHWRHCHVSTDNHDHIHPFAYSNLFADALHNAIDGILIGAAFYTSPEVGIATAIAVGLHEIPQEFADMGVLIHAGFSNKKAILVNFITAMTSVAGLVFVYFVGREDISYVKYFLPITAGGFLYIAISDLMPELKHHESVKKSLLQLVFFILGILISVGLLFLE